MSPCECTSELICLGLYLVVNASRRNPDLIEGTAIEVKHVKK